MKKSTPYGRRTARLHAAGITLKRDGITMARMLNSRLTQAEVERIVAPCRQAVQAFRTGRASHAQWVTLCTAGHVAKAIEDELLQALIDQGEAAIATVLTEHAMQPITSPTTKGTTVTVATIIPPAPLTTWQGQGGIYIGIKATPDGKAFYVVAAIGAHEFEDQQWGEYGKRITGADSYHDGRANTETMAAAGSALAQKILALDIEGHTDWALPSQADGHLLAANAKHLMQQDECYWLSTQYSAHYAWYQDFTSGTQDTYSKDCEFRAVPVRCIQIV